MIEIPPPLREALEALETLPGIGPRSAERLAYHLLRAPEQDTFRLADAIRALREKLHPCSVCSFLAESDPCSICSDPRRQRDAICVVESPRDLMAIEQTGQYGGLYHVLMGRIDPLAGQGPESLPVEALLRRIAAGGVAEVILATNPDLEGDGTALYLAKRLAPTGVRVTRLARGLPSGSSIEYASLPMLTDALRGRRDVSGEAPPPPRSGPG